MEANSGIFIVVRQTAAFPAVKSCAVEKAYLHICQSKIVQLGGFFGKSSEHHIDSVILHYIVYTVIVFRFLATSFSLLFFIFSLGSH